MTIAPGAGRASARTVGHDGGRVRWGDRMHYWDGWGIFSLVVMGVGTVLFWALVVLAIVALVRYLQHTGSRASGPSPAEEVLAERFARGEIDEEEYRRRLQTLNEHRRR